MLVEKCHVWMNASVLSQTTARNHNEERRAATYCWVEWWRSVSDHVWL